MEFHIRKMEKDDWKSVAEIYQQGIRTKKATFQTEAPEYDEWDKSHLKTGRFVAVDDNENVLGWIALTPTSGRCVYWGVVEVSVYVGEASRNKNVGFELIKKEIEVSENEGIWMLQSGIMGTNEASIALHKKCGFRIVGTREKIGRDMDGNWQDTVLMERRSKTVGM
jgi:phosphinothricin acetyltransferase